MQENIKNIEVSNTKHHLCEVCGEYMIEYSHQICKVCGWQNNCLLEKNKDTFGGSSILSCYQYQKVWLKNKEIIANTKMLKYNMVVRIFEKNPNSYGGYYNEDQKSRITKQIQWWNRKKS